ncbi:AI-2E family transporter [Pantoea sp. 18069]|uniref:AI-2E family transporter n=1 Tax=Pantoea sp. 18069 TaxID=2681415 RepID=UPI00135C6E26|nr:AI-2E family transporter [Pantoea sp. 18069]
MPETFPDPAPLRPQPAPAQGEAADPGRNRPEAQDRGPVEAPVFAQLASMLPALRVLIGLLIAALVISGLFFGRELLVPLALALLLGFLLDPAVSRLKRWGLSRMAATLLVVTITLGALGGMGAYLGNQVSQLSADLPTYQNTIRTKLRDLRKFASGPSVWDGARKTYDTVEREIASPGGRTPAPRVQKVEIQPVELKPMAQFTAWLDRVSEPVLMAGIVLLFVVLILLDRDDLRDRLLRLMGGNLHLATNALDEASERIGRYLRMQFIVNASYGIPMAAGLWFIGVPGAILWGVVAAIMRFVPYVGPMVSAVFPLALAFAVDPGWNMFLWTLCLILLLELISNNVVEPWLYGASTGLSTLSIIVAATFWTALWGPVGLILSTPLTVCLLVLGRYLPALKFIEVLLGNAPVLDAPRRLYQRLLGGDVEEAIELCTDAVDVLLPARPTAAQVSDGVTRLYDEVVMPALRVATSHHTDAATAAHRLRLAQGMELLLAELAEQYPVRASADADAALRPRVHCVGARWEVDALAAAAMAHALALGGHAASHSAHALSARMQAPDDASWGDVELLCLSVFTPQPQAQVRQICRRLHRRWPGLRIVLALWNAPPALLAESAAAQLGVQALTTSVRELRLRADAMLASSPHAGPRAAPVGEDDVARVAALNASGWLDANHTGAIHDMVVHAANAFHVPFAQVSLVDADWVHTPGTLLTSPGDGTHSGGLERALSICSYVVHGASDLQVEDIARDPRFADNPLLQSARLRFYAGVPLRDRHGMVLGSFCIMDTVPRSLAANEFALLNDMARQLQATLSRSAEVPPPPDAGPSAPAAPAAGPAADSAALIVPGAGPAMV